ncbi:MAG TPA: Hsp70 family protein [Pyrinomonadaceae bacterium]|jgi:molecular chaperone DnaK (HSP70)
MSSLVGIDLGTTNSAIAHINALGRAEVLPNGEGKKVTPSVVQICADGSTLVGEAAKLEMALEKENTAHFFKRDMGTPIVYEYHGRTYSPVDLSAEVLKQLKSDAEAALGTEVMRAVITVPAYFHDGPRVATREAGEKAGFEVAQIINEPTAAALAYCLKQADHEEVVMVYDLGGGTFDITLVRISPDSIEVIGTDGNHTLGGKDWDDRLLEYLCEEFERRQGINPLDDPYAFQELLIRAEEAKKALSARSNTVVPINCQGRMDRIEVTRERFENLTGDLLSQTEMLMNKVLEETAYDYSRVSSVLMVGGSTRMPACQDLIRRLTGKAPNTSVNPDECVALGAAIQGASYDGDERSLTYRQSPAGGGLIMRRTVQDVMSHSMGMAAVSADGSRYINSILIPKNQHIPCREVRPYKVRTREGANNSTSVYVAQGEGDDLGNCSFVGKYVISGIAHDKKDAVLNISYEYDRSGVVSVSASEKKSGRGLTVTKEPVPEDMSWIYKSPKELAVAAHKTIYLAVDLSGSMSGQPLEEAKRAVNSFIHNSDLSHTSIGLISFSDEVRIDQKATQNGRSLCSAVSSWAINGNGLGYGNSAQPFDSALAELGDVKGPRYFVVLTDGVWSYQEKAIERARACHKAGIEIIAIGFGGADQNFLQSIATSDQSAMLVGSGDLISTFENIAQVLVEGGGDSFASGLFLRRR